MTAAAIDVLVVGAGVTGLAAANAIAARGRSVCVLESHPRPGMETSTHNSGVIHAGLYYPPGSFKARYCVEGRDALYAFCAQHGVPHAKTGKLVVADDGAREPELEALAARAAANGAVVELLAPGELQRRAPGVHGARALWSPHTGIVDASRLVAALTANAVTSDVALLPSTRPLDVEATAGTFEVRTDRETIRALAVVNAAGLFADDVSRLFGGEAFRIWPCRGDYATLTPRASARVTLPVYPMPDTSGHGLGVHLTPTIDGEVLLGPTIHHQASKTDYESDRPSLDAFLDAARRLMPSLEPGDIRAGGSGIRAKLHPPDESFADFMIRPDTRQPRLFHAAGIDSPGLTSCLAIGAAVAAMVDEAL